MHRCWPSGAVDFDSLSLSKFFNWRIHLSARLCQPIGGPGLAERWTTYVSAAGYDALVSDQPLPPQGQQRLRDSRSRRTVRIVVRILVGSVAWILGVPLSFFALLAFPPAFDDTGMLSTLGVLLGLLAAFLWLSVFARHRWPWIPFVIGAVLATAWGDGTLMLIGLFHLLVRSPRKQALTATAIGALLITVGVVRLCLQSPANNPFGILFLSDPNQIPGVDGSLPADESVFGMNMLTVIAGLMGLAISLGFGFLLRRTRRMRAVESFAQRQSRRSENLSAELARTSERELLARELHDTLSHRLSVISLHSGALEVGGNDDPAIASTASALRQEAHASLEDLRHLVGGVREGTLANAGPQKEASTPPSLTSMRSIPQLVASVQATGTIIRPSIIIQDVESAPTVLDRAVYRIVQESLTNAMKHAPGAPVTLGVTVSADLGARVVIANPAEPSAQRFHPPRTTTEAGPGIPPYPTSAPRVGPANPGAQQSLSSTGAGAGLVGIRERVAMLGGEVFIGVRDGSFLVDVTLPPFERQG